MNNTHLKRLFTIFLSLMLSISMLPAGVFAEAVNGSEEQDQVVTEEVDQNTDQTETPAPEQPADVNKGSSEPADAVEKSEYQGQVATETVDQAETSAPEQSADVNKGSSEPADAVEKAEKDTPKGESYDFEMNGEKWVISGDASADTEDEKTWKAMFADSKFTDNWAEDLVMVAKSQVGYKESKKNFAVSENKDRKGYTRYGAWAGEPYADWSPFFVSFCLHYANVDMPYYKEGFDKWITDLEKEKMFADADGYVPRSGDLVFFDNDKDGDVDAAGIVESYDEEKGVIETIEGDYEDEVAEREVKTSDPAIAGYGILPENPEVSDEAKTEQEETTEKTTEEIAEVQNEIPQVLNDNVRKLLNAIAPKGDGEEPPANGTNTAEKKNILDFIPPGTLTLVHAKDGTSIDELHPAVPGERVILAFSISEQPNGIQFDMDEMYLPSVGLVPADVTEGISEVEIKDVDLEVYTLKNPYTIGTDGKITYTWQNPCTEERDGRVVDVYALAKRAENIHYNLSIEMLIGTDDDEIKFTDELSFPVDRSVQLTVTKAIFGLNSITSQQAEDMKFVVRDANGNIVKEFSRDEMQEDESGVITNAQIKFTGLTAENYPAVFTVEEINYPTISGYTFIEADSERIKTVTIPAGQNGTAQLKNVYKQDVGHLVIKKSFPSGSELGNGMTKAQKQSIKFTVKDSAGNVVASGNYYDNFVNGVWDVGDFPPGAYTVIEEKNTITGYTRTTTYTVDSTQSGEGGDAAVEAPVTIDNGGEHEVAYSNSYKRQKDNLTLTKTISGANLTDEEKRQITFTIKYPDGTTKTVNYKDHFNSSGVYVLENVPTGTYKVTETNALAGYTVEAKYKVNNGQEQDLSGTVNVSVTSGGTNKVDFVNKYTPVGRIVLKKSVGGNYWTNENQKTRRTKISGGVQYKLYKVEGTTRTEVQTVYLTAFEGTGDTIGSFTFEDIPYGTYEIDEIVGDGGEIPYTTRTTKVTVNDGDTVTANPPAKTVHSGNFTVAKDVEPTVTYENNYDKKQGKIKLEKIVTKDGQTVDPTSIFSDADKQKAVIFTVSGKDVYGNDVSVQVSLYDILNPTNPDSPLTDDGWLVVPYSDTTDGYTVKETGANVSHYIRVTTAKVDDVDSTTTTPSVTIDDTTTSHKVTYNNDYTTSGVLRIDKTITGALTDSEKTDLRKKIYFTVADTSGRPIVRDATTGTLKLGQSGDTAAHFTLAQMEAGISIPVGTYIVTEHNMEYKPEIYDYSTTNSQVFNGTITVGPASAETEVTINNDKIVYYTNHYTRPGIGTGVYVHKQVLIEGVASGTFSDDFLEQFEEDVLNSISFEFYEGTSASGTPKYTYTYNELRRDPPKLPIGTWTVKEIGFEVEGFKHYIVFSVSGQNVTPVTTYVNSVTFTLARDSEVSIDVKNGYTPLVTLHVQKLFDSNSAIKPGDLTATQKKAIKFRVTGYSSIGFDPDDMSSNTIIWPPAGETRPKEFTYADMTSVNGVMTKTFKNIPTGVYVVEEVVDGSKFTNYTVHISYDPEGTGLAIPFGSEGTQKVINNFTRDTGSLIIYKEILGPLPSELGDGITFTVKDSNGKTIDTFTYADIKDVRYREIPNLPTGKYTITETNADFEDECYERTTTVQVNTGSVTPYTSGAINASVEKGKTTKVYINNEYKEMGYLVIDKTIDETDLSNALPDSKKNITFTVYRKEGDKLTEINTITYEQILKYKQDNPGAKGYRFLVLPGEYVIKETRADFEGYTRVTTATVDDTGTAYSDENGVSTGNIIKFDGKRVAFNNKYKEIGSLKIKKVVTGFSSLTDAQKQAIKFTVKKKDGGAVVKEFTFAEMDAAGEITISPLDLGLYTIEETVLNEASVFYGKTRKTTVQVESGAPTDSMVVNVEADSTTPMVTYRNVYSNSDKLSVTKTIGGAPFVYIKKADGSTYPVWKFRLRIDNLEPSTTEDGMVDLIDIYDKDYLKLFHIVTDDADLDAITAKQSENEGDAKEIANKITLEEGVSGEKADVELITNYDSSVTFRIKGVDANTAKDGNYLYYFLIPKDQEALAKLNSKDGTESPSAPNVLEKHFTNIVKYKELPSATDYSEARCNYEYINTVVMKECTNYDTETQHLTDGHGHVVDYAEYQFIINPNAQKLSSDGYIDVTDTFSNNQSVNSESITVYRYDPATKQTSPTVEGDVKYKDMHGNTIVLTLRDETCFIVKYRSVILYTTAQAGQILKMENEVTVEGFKHGIKPEVIPSSEGGGSVFQIRLRKYQTGNLDNPLKGAVFKMYLSKEDAEADIAADNNYANAIGTYTTGADGVILIEKYTYKGEEHNVTADPVHPIRYAFVETEAPEGYDMIDYIVEVQLAADGQTADYTHYIYLRSDTVGIKDKPYETKINLGAHKIIQKINSERTPKEGEFSFKLKAKGNAPMPKGTDAQGVITKSNKADGNAVFGTIKYITEDVVTRKENGDVDLEKLDKTFYYELSEELPEGVTPENPKKDGIIYDTTTYTIAVHVVLDLDSGALIVESVKVKGKDDTWKKIDSKEGLDTDPDPIYVDDVEQPGIPGPVDEYLADVTNEYTAEGEATLHIKKELGDGDTWPAGRSAVFTLTRVTEGAPMPTATGGTTVTLTSEAVGEFGKINYSLINAGKEYEYKISETTGFGDGWTNAKPIKATVKVLADTGTGQLTTEVTYDPENFTAINDYDAKGEATLHIKKVVKASGKTVTWPWPAGKSAEFTLTAVTSGAPMPTATDGDKVTLTSEEVGEFGTIEYPLTSAGQEYEYLISETKGFGDGDGWTDADPIKVKVEVGPDEGNGKLETTVTYDPEDFTATNDYDATGSIPLKGTKKFKYGIFGADDPNDTRKKNFTFSVYPKDDFDKALKPMLLPERDRNDESFINAVKDAKVGTATTSGATVEGDIASFDFKFKAKGGTTFDKDQLEYTLADILEGGHKNEAGYWTKEFYYVVVEDIPGSAVKKTVDGKTFYYDKTADIKYDPTVYEVEITVTDNGRGSLIVTKNVKVDGNVVPNSSGADYKFGFKNEKIYTKLKLTKVIDQQVAQDTEGELTNVTFVFKISYTDPVLGKPVGRTVSVQFDPKTGAANPNPAIVDKIPIESEVKVTEVYAADYQCDGNPTQDAKLTVDTDNGIKIFTVSFSNNRQGNTTGSGVINTVDKNTFRITNRQDSTGTNQPPKAPR